MKFIFLFLALLSGVIGFWLGLLVAVVLGLHEKIYAMSVALGGAGIFLIFSTFIFNKLPEKIKSSKIIFFVFAIFGVAALAATFFRINR